MREKIVLKLHVNADLFEFWSYKSATKGKEREAERT